MSKQRKQKEYKAAPPITGLMTCQNNHQWNVVDLNPERVAVGCPVCAGYTSIRQGFSNERRK